MQKTLINPHFIESLLGYSRYHCTHILLNKGIDSVEFGHWLAIPSQQLLLTFRHQHCVAVEGYQAVA